MLREAKVLTSLDVINAVRFGLPLPSNVSGFTLGQLNTINRFIELIERKESKRLHGRVDWNRPAMEIIFNWCIAYRGMWDDLGSYQRFLEGVNKHQPDSIVSRGDYEVFFATVFYTVKHNLEAEIGDTD